MGVNTHKSPQNAINQYICVTQVRSIQPFVEKLDDSETFFKAQIYFKEIFLAPSSFQATSGESRKFPAHSFHRSVSAEVTDVWLKMRRRTISCSRVHMDSANRAVLC